MTRDMLKFGLILGIVCAVAGAGLASVYAQTKIVIDQRREADFQKLLQRVVPQAQAFERVEKEGKEFFVGLAGGTTVGYAVRTSTGGYGGQIEIIVGTDADLKINGVQIVSHKETQGLGSKIQSPDFTDRFKGKTPSDPISIGQDIQGITGATISAKAVAGGVKKALADLSVAFLGSGTSGVDLKSVPDGTYTGVGQGFNGPVKVSVKVAGGKIEKVTILEHKESAGIADPALTGIPDAMVKKQSVNVDEISGATWSSRGIIEAVQDALKEYVSKK